MAISDDKTQARTYILKEQYGRIRRDAFERNISISAMIALIIEQYYDASDTKNLKGPSSVKD